MGLPKNEKYEPTAHFKKRLAERFNIHGAAWKLYMRQLYSKLFFDEEATKNNKLGKEVYIAKDKGIVVVVDSKNFKLITIYHEADFVEEEIIRTKEEIIDNKIEEEINKEFSLEDFAAELLQEEKDLRAKNKFKYAQKVLQTQRESIEEFIDIYKLVIDGEASVECIHKMNRLRNVEKKLHKVFGKLEFPEK